MDAIVLLSSDHRRIRLLFGDYRVATTDRQRRKTADTLVRELSKHTTAEERIFYPFAAQALGEDATARPHRICSAIKRHLTVLDGHRRAAEDDAMSMAQLEQDIAEHIEEDEQKLMPRLRAACEPDVLRHLGSKLERVERGAPTRPHPREPDQAPNPLLRTPFVTWYDRIRDRVRGRAGT